MDGVWVGLLAEIILTLSDDVSLNKIREDLPVPC